jgi:hypothetical protein
MKQKQLYTVVALLFFAAGAISFPAHRPRLGAMWLCIGVLFFAIGRGKS